MQLLFYPSRRLQASPLSLFQCTWLDASQDVQRHDVLSNMWEHDAMPIKRQRIAYVQSRGPGCFDTTYYLAKNQDLQVIPTPLQLWDHFVTNGQFEGRSFR